MGRYQYRRLLRINMCRKSCRVTESENQDGRAFGGVHENCLDMYSAGENKTG